MADERKNLTDQNTPDPKDFHRIEKDGNVVNIFINFGQGGVAGGSGSPDNKMAGGSGKNENEEKSSN